MKELSKPTITTAEMQWLTEALEEKAEGSQRGEGGAGSRTAAAHHNDPCLDEKMPLRTR